MRREGLILVTMVTAIVASDTRLERYALILSDPPVAEFIASHKQASPEEIASYRGKIDAAQERLRRELTNCKIVVTGSVKTTLNAVFVLASPDRLPELKHLPGVKGVTPMRRFSRLGKAK